MFPTSEPQMLTLKKEYALHYLNILLIRSKDL